MPVEWKTLGALLALVAATACGDNSSGSPIDGGAGLGGSGGSAAAGGSPGAGGLWGIGGASTGGSGGSDGTGGAGGAAASSGSGGGSGGDPYLQQREVCINRINELRATKGLPPFQRWVDGEPCADKQALDDSTTNVPHGAWSSGKFGCDGGSSQNECPGWSGAGCIDAMWGENTRPACSNCDNCPGDSGCDGCDFDGSTTGTVCGHYENLSAKGYTKVACGFGGGWEALNFK